MSAAPFVMTALCSSAGETGHSIWPIMELPPNPRAANQQFQFQCCDCSRAVMTFLCLAEHERDSQRNEAKKNGLVPQIRALTGCLDIESDTP